MSLVRFRSTRRGEPPAVSAIGWISTSDALLFGVGVLVFISSGMAKKLHDSEVVNAQLLAENRRLTQELATAEEYARRIVMARDVAEQRLADTDSQLALAREKIDLLSGRIRTIEGDLAALAIRYAEATFDQEYSQLQHAMLNDQLRSQGAKIAALQATIDGMRQINRERIGAFQSQVDMKTAEFRRLQQEFDVMKAGYTEAIQENNKIKSELTRALNALDVERHFRRELIGVKGRFSSVAILLDRSGSMREGGRWEDAKSVMRSWIDHLQMDACVVIVFSSDVETFPPNGQLLNLKGTEGAKNRAKLASYLEGVQPDGATNTLKALEVAYGYQEIDTIVLFTDGAPNDGNAAKFDPAIAAKIRALVNDKSGIPINAVGLGDYFRPELSEFLLGLAKTTNGTFLGR